MAKSIQSGDCQVFLSKDSFCFFNTIWLLHIFIFEVFVLVSFLKDDLISKSWGPLTMVSKCLSPFYR